MLQASGILPTLIVLSFVWEDWFVGYIN